MGNITSCTIDTVYKTFLVINRDGNKDCLVTGAGNVFGGSLAIGGTLTGSITTNHIQVAGLGVNPMYEIYSGSNELLFKINSNGNAEFEERKIGRAHV